MVILFIQRTLLPTLLPFNGYNPNSVVVMDNCSIHHVPEMIELIRSVGTIVVFLPRTVLILHLSRRCLAKSRTLFGSMRLYSRQPPIMYLVLDLIPWLNRTALAGIKTVDMCSFYWHAITFVWLPCVHTGWDFVVYHDNLQKWVYK